MLQLICNTIKNLIHREGKPYDKSVHAREEFYTYDFIIVSSLINLIYKNNPLSNLLVKIYHFGHRELLASKVLLI